MEIFTHVYGDGHCDTDCKNNERSRSKVPQSIGGIELYHKCAYIYCIVYTCVRYHRAVIINNTIKKRKNNDSRGKPKDFYDDRVSQKRY